MEFNETNIYGKVKLSDIFKEIHQKNKFKENKIKELIEDLSKKITSTGEAMLVVPLLAKYMEISIKNDDNLLKMAAIIQKAVSTSNKNNSDDFELSEKEKEDLLSEIQKLNKN